MHKETIEIRDIKIGAILVGIQLKTTSKEDALSSLQELHELVETAGFEVTAEFLIHRDSLDPQFLIGTGKAEEILISAKSNNAKIIIFDEQLNPRQSKNLNNFFNLKIIDRVEIILDIFYKHASSHEAKIQIELAQLKYTLPRLARMWLHLSRQEGSLGVRGGPGEKQIEIDKRRIKDKIHDLNDELEEIAKQRKLQRKSREKSKILRFSIIGYTNAGKSSLFNVLTHANALVKNQLFSTLDSLSRKININGSKEVIISDTVGFIRNLPHFLIEAFQSTLEEVIDADCLIHIIDATANDIHKKIDAVSNVLYEELKINDKKIIKVLNKIDLISEDKRSELEEDFNDAILISAKSGQGVDNLINEIISFTNKSLQIKDFFIPIKEMKLKENFYGSASIIKEEYTENGLKITALVNEQIIGILKKYIVTDERIL